MADNFPTYVNEVQTISAVPRILETVAATTGLGFVAIAHVTPDSWTTCAVLDNLGFGLKVGDPLDVKTTLCEEVRCFGEAIVIDSVRQSEKYRDHHTPRMYGFDSYFSIPIFRRDGAYFGTLCGLDPEPKPLSSGSTMATLQLFAELISHQLEREQAHADAQNALLSERETSELREQFIAVLGHDLRTPLGVIQTGIQLLGMKHPDPGAVPLLQRMQRSVGRMTALVDDVVDFTRGRMGAGLSLTMRYERSVNGALNQVIDELRELYPQQEIVAELQPDTGLLCDLARLSQLLSNLLKNAIVHGDAGAPVYVTVASASGLFSLSVTNRGAQLAPEVIGQLFKPFWRSSATASHDGLGLGLYIVSQIASSHGGTMDVTSSDGNICFVFKVHERDDQGSALVAFGAPE